MTDSTEVAKQDNKPKYKTVSPIQKLILIYLRLDWKLVPKTKTSFYLTSTPHKPTRGRHKIVYLRTLKCMIRDGILSRSGLLTDEELRSIWKRS